jgi:hypothetical protein
MEWITAEVLAGVTIHAMTGGSVVVGLRRDIPLRAVKVTMARTPLT